jgi:hypothetical protein
MSRVGIWYVKDGIEAIPLLLWEVLRSFGGEIRLGERVESIIMQDGAVTGVELAGGTNIKAPYVIPMQIIEKPSLAYCGQTHSLTMSVKKYPGCISLHQLLLYFWVSRESWLIYPLSGEITSS